MPLLAPLIDVPLPPERASTLAPEELRRRQMAAILTWFVAGARTQPVVLAFEDLHWADPTTLDILRGFAERGALAPLLVIATTRPEFRAPWGARSHHGTITLAPLDRVQVRQMVGALAERHALTNDVIDGVSERTGGVPLFVEEVTRLILERGGQGGAQAGALETMAAFAKARELARGEKDAPERLAANYGLWVGSFTRGELAAMRAHAAAFLGDVEARPDSPEAGVAHRVLGATHWFAGEYVEARDHLERALVLFQPGRDDDLAFRFGQDVGVGAMAYGDHVVGSRRRRSRLRLSTPCSRGSRISRTPARLPLEGCTRRCSN